MNITFLTQGFPPRHSAGTEVYTYNIANALKDAGHSVSVFCVETVAASEHSRYEIQTRDEINNGLMVRSISYNWTLAPDRHGYIYLYNPEIFSVTQQFLREQQPDIVHITSLNHLSASVITAAKQLQLPVVATFTSYWVICPRTTLLRHDGMLCSGKQDGITCLKCLYGNTKTLYLIRLLPRQAQQALLRQTVVWESLARWNGSLNLMSAVERRNAQLPRILEAVDYIISPSNFLADVIAKSGILPRERIHVSPHGHNVACASLGRVKTPSDYLRFGYTGHLLPHKGVHLLISTFNQLASNHRARLLIYGDLQADVAYGQQLRQLAAGNPAIEFRGPFKNQEIGHILSEIDIVVVPSVWYENAPVTIAEAFAAQTPVIASRLGGMAEAVRHQVDGLLFEAGNTSALAQEMQRFIENPQLLLQLKQQIKPVRTTADEAEELERIYKRLMCVGSQGIASRRT